jgi:membrane protease YdiL (CAAX protease family)
MVWVIAFGMPFLFSTIATAIRSDQQGSRRFPAWYAIIPPIAFAVVLFGPLCEEIGWRGYLQPKLLERVLPVRAAFFVGIIWTAWHFPLSFTPGATTPLDSFQAVATYLISTIGISAIMLTITVAGRGSIALSIAFHWSANVALFQFIRPIFASATIAQWQQIDAITGWFHFVFGIACLIWLKKYMATHQVKFGKVVSI